MEENAIVAVNFEDYAMSTESVVRQIGVIQDVMRSVMKEDEHFGTIPGTNKPSLLKPGAEKLSLVFRLRPEYLITKTDLPGGHREYEITCSLYHIPTGAMVGQGVGSATTMENKYRFRGGEKEGTGKPIPTDYWNLKKKNPDKAKELLGGEGYAPGKIDGKWEICIIGEKVEHDNPADYYNTVLKMSKKRAHVDAILTATAASDIFTQDTEDLAENGVIKGETKKAPPKAGGQKKSGKGGEEKKDEGEKVVVGIKSIVQKSGKKSNGDTYVRYVVTDANDIAYSTFDKNLATKAAEARDNGVNAIISFKKSQYGNDILSIDHDVPNFEEETESAAV